MKTILIYAGLLLMITACSSLTITEKVDKRNELDKMAAKTVTDLLAKDASLQHQLDASIGYAVVNMKVTKIPIVGAGGGEGVFVNSKTGKTTYFTVSRFDIGGGWGVRSYKALFVMTLQKALDRFEGGTWAFQSGVEASAGSASTEGSLSTATEGYTVHILSDGGASATATARVIRVKINEELTEL